jgi:predicted MFS family arabinose efflux permease
MASASGVLFLFGIVVVGTRVVFAKLPDRVPPFRLGAVALGLSALGLLVAAAVETVPGLLVGAAVLGVGVAFTTPAFFAAIFSRVAPAQRGSASGTASLFIDLAFGGGPLVLGMVAETAGIAAAFAVAATLSIAGALATASLAARDR